MYHIAISDLQQRIPLNETDIESLCRDLLSDEQVATASISLAFVNDATIHQLNRDHLDHDYPTDVISFLLDERSEPSPSHGVPSAAVRGQGKHLEGEVIVSTDTAANVAAKYHWRAEDEALLYVVHGLLHLVGYDDLSDDEQALMRRREREHLAKRGLTPRYDDMDNQPPETNGHGNRTTTWENEA